MHLIIPIGSLINNTLWAHIDSLALSAAIYPLPLVLFSIRFGHFASTLWFPLQKLTFIESAIYFYFSAPTSWSVSNPFPLIVRTVLKIIFAQSMTVSIFPITYVNVFGLNNLKWFRDIQTFIIIFGKV